VVDLDKGTWFDHEAKEGGGCLDLIERELGLTLQTANKWLNEKVLADAAPASDRDYEAESKETPKLAKTWNYVDAYGKPLFQVCRLEYRLKPGERKPRKTFRQRRRDPGGEWIWNTDGVNLVPYRLPELIEAISRQQAIFFVEGEKCVDALMDLDIPATTNPMGAGKWWDELTEQFRDARLVIIPDNDEAGRKHAGLMAEKLQGVAAEIRIVPLMDVPKKGDVVDWINAGGTAELSMTLPWPRRYGRGIAVGRSGETRRTAVSAIGGRNS
jgi:hypothetical protein